MRYFILLFIVTGALMTTFPARAESHWSVGLGGGFGDESVGPGLVSAKYWTDWLEIGAEGFFDGKKGDTERDDIDQMAIAWLIYRYDLHQEENNTPWIGAGYGAAFEANLYEDDFGPVAVLGWDGKGWGIEFKYAYFDPSLYSFAVYYDIF